jgi:hypothetical protein
MAATLKEAQELNAAILSASESRRLAAYSRQSSNIALTSFEKQRSHPLGVVCHRTLAF